MQHTVGIMMGQAWPSGEIGRNLDGTIAPGIFYEYAASDVFSVFAQVVRTEHNDGALRVTSINTGMKAHLIYYDILAPYVVVGAGLYAVGKDYSVPSERADKTVFGILLGFGADLDISDRFTMGMEFDIHTLFAATTVLPSSRRVDISGRWTGFFLRGGVRF